MSIPEELRIKGVAIVADDDSVVASHPTSGALRHMARRLAAAADHLQLVEEAEARRQAAIASLGPDVKHELADAAMDAADTVWRNMAKPLSDIVESAFPATATPADLEAHEQAQRPTSARHSMSLFVGCVACGNPDFCNEAPF